MTAIAVCMRDPVFERTLSIVTGSTDGTILVWEATGGVRFAITCEDPVLALAFCQRSNPHDGEICSEITASLSGGVLSVWDLRMGDFVRTIKENQGGLGDSEGYNQGHDSIISLALYVPEHGGAPPLAVTGGKDGVAMIWNYTHGGRPCKLEGGHGMTITCLAVHVPPQEGSPALVVTGSKDDTCIVWDISSGVKVRTLEADESIKCVAIHQPEEGNPQVIAGTVIGDLHIWDLHTGEVIRKIDCGHILSLALFEADDGGSEVAMVATCDNGSDSAVKVWRISDGAQKLSLNCEHNSVQVVAVFTSTTCYKELNVAGFSDDVFIIGGHFGHTATVWMYPSGKTLHTLKGAHTGPITALAVSPSHQERPILVTGSADCTAVVWDLISGQVKFVLKGEHEDSVTSVLLDDSSGTLLAVTSSADSTVAVWNATTGEHIRSLTATDGVTALAAYHPSDGATTARILAACEDCTVKVWADCLLPSDYMPLAGSVMKLMEMEIAQAATIGTSAAATTTTAPWSRLREVADNYGESFWLENYRLFSSMFESSVKPTVRDSFFRTFKAALPKVIHRLPNVLGKSKGKRKSLLEVCIEDNLDIRRIVLDAWVVTLNSPISSSDFLRQAYHPSVHLSKEVLLKLAQSNPGEFISFICRLKLVKSHEAVFKSCPTYDIDRKGGVIIEGMPPTVSVDMWSSIAGYYASKTAPTGIKGPQPVTALMIPLIGAADLQMLNAYVDTSNAVDSLDIFESDVGITAFKYAWVSFGYPIHIVTTLRYASFIALYTASVFLFDRLQQNRRFSVYFWAWALQCAVLLCILYYMVDEARQFWNENKERVEQAAQRVKEQKERAKELARRKLEQTEEEKEGKYEPGQHRRHFISKSAKATAATTARRRNPALYTGCRYVLATLELKILTSLEACALKLASICNVGRVLAQWWDSSVLRMVLKHFSGFWNMVDLAVMATVTAGTVLRCVNLGETNSSRCILSVGSVLVWFKVLNFMRPFKHSGPLGKFYIYVFLFRLKPFGNRSQYFLF